MTDKQWRSAVIFLLTILIVIFLFIPSKRESPLPENQNSALTASPGLNLPPIQMTTSSDVRAIYVTAQVAARPSRINNLIDLIKSTELNAMVINVKDSDGAYLDSNMQAVVKKLLTNGIYPIARMVVFQDNFLARTRPELALKNRDGSVWSGKNGALWIDPASIAAWDYNTNIAEEALKLGFKEINLDYIRFPSDGDVTAIKYPFYDEVVSPDEILGQFYGYFSSRIKSDYPKAVLSIDLFAFSFIKNDGLGVGQKVPTAAKYFDVLSPMVYPSHFAPQVFGFENPAEHPYEVVSQTLKDGKTFFPESLKKAIVRPWIQSFNLGAVYDPKMVREEVRAIADEGLGNNWMVWNPNNVYDPSNFLKR